MACFPMVPVVNRIPQGRFSFEGQSVQLEKNLLGTEDFIHGYGWTNPWTVDVCDARQVHLSFNYDGGAWPWAFTAQQIFTLRDKSLSAQISVINQSDSPMPAAIGFHPYFPATKQTKLCAQYTGHWETNDQQHALRRILGPCRKDFRDGASLLDDQALDVSHFGWSGSAKIYEPGRPEIILTADKNAKHLHVYYLPDGDFVAVEPTTGRSNMFGPGPCDYEVLAPGESLKTGMKIIFSNSEGG